jgi:hypothetical protein
VELENGQGFCCPEPLTEASPLSEMLATAEAFVPSEALMGRPTADECAETLATLVALTGEAGKFPELAPPLPWVAWDHEGPGQWPPPDDLDVALNEPPGPRWLEDAAHLVRSRMAADSSPPAIGHCDWEAPNLGFRDGHVAVVYDWDSLGIRSEPALAGVAAAGLLVLLYNARKELAGGGKGYLDHLSRELQVRLQYAGMW